MMMGMLAAGGMPILTDHHRTADAHNPTGYFEFEPVKELASSPPQWLENAQGHAVKIVSFLLTWLPETHDYRVIFMRRELREVVASQHDMLVARRGSPPPDDLEHAVDVHARHLEDVARFIAARPCFTLLDVEHRATIADPATEAARIAAFLQRPLDVAAMAKMVDTALYRHRDREDVRR